MMSLLRRCLGVPRQRWLLLFNAFGSLLHAVVLVRCQPFQRIAKRLGQQGSATDGALTQQQAALARDVEWAIGALCRRWPRAPTCLMQAIAAKFMLAKSGVPATLYIGVAPRLATGAATDAAINAHAWLRCGERVVTGRAQARQFKAMVWFGA